MAWCGLQIIRNLSHHRKTALDRQQKLQLLRVVLCSFHVDAPLAHQLNEIQNSILTLPHPCLMASGDDYMYMYRLYHEVELGLYGIYTPRAEGPEAV